MQVTIESEDLPLIMSILLILMMWCIVVKNYWNCVWNI